MNMHTKSGNIVGASCCTLSQSIQYAAVTPIKAMLYWYIELLTVYRIWKAMKYHFSADNHAFSYAIAPVNGLDLASFIDITTYIARTSYFCFQDDFGASYS